MKKVTLQDGSLIEAGLIGNPDHKTIMLPGAKKSVTGKDADYLKLWGVDPDLGKNFVEGLSDRFQVLYFDYEGHLLENPNPDHLTPEYIVKDFLLIADEMNVEKFSYYGYSWLALVGLQLAIRTDRLEGLIMGGFPPYEGPYKEMLIVTEKTHEMAKYNVTNPQQYVEQSTGPEDIDWDNVPVTMDPSQTKQFVTMYRYLIDFDDKKANQKLSSLPKLTFAGEKDSIVYGVNYGSVTVNIVGPLQKNKKELESLGWDVQIIMGDDMDHTKAMQPKTVLPLIKPWLINNVL